MVDFPTGFSKVTIANMALSNIGARSTISSFLENSAEASNVNLWYEYCRLQTLQSYNWAFARKRVSLVVSDEDADGVQWQFRYLLPDDCVAVRLLENPIGKRGKAVPYDIELSPLGVKSLVTNLEEAVAIYTSNVSDVTIFSPLFIDTLACCIGWRIAFPITGDRNIQDDQAKLFRFMLLSASAQDANESVDDEPQDADWISFRR